MLQLRKRRVLSRVKSKKRQREALALYLLGQNYDSIDPVKILRAENFGQSVKQVL